MKSAFKRNRLEPIFSLISEWRDSNVAPVDTMGCDALAEKKDLKRFRFQTLIALILSSQTKDQTVAEAMRKLQQHDLSVDGVLKMNKDILHECISKVGFHNRKLGYILETCQIIVDRYDGDIPKDINDLMKLPGVGPKMAYLTMQVAWNEIIGIGVDTHVHRISNRIGWVKTRTPEESRLELEDWLPKSHWAKINHLLVGFGQLHCKPVKPSCHDCPVNEYCQKNLKARK